MRSNTLISKLVILFLLFVLSGEKVIGQQPHFLYIQSDNFQPFYMKFNNQVFSSSATGYLIVGKLNVSNLKFEIGLPQSNQPECSFQVQFENGDKGFLFKNFGDKGWGLYELQKSTIQYAIQRVDSIKIHNDAISTTSNGETPFGTMLAWVTKDSTVTRVTKNIPVSPPAPKKEDEPVSVTTPLAVDTPLIAQKEQVIDTVATVRDQPLIYNKSGIRLVSRSESREGIDYRFEVQESLLVDTVWIFVDRPLPIQDSTQLSSSNVAHQGADTVAQNTPLQQGPMNVKEADPLIPSPVVDEGKGTVPPVGTSVPNTNCKSYATDDVFLKLRKKMAGCNSEESMVNEAKKVFRTKCFTTAQIRNLGVLFLTDEWRYRFYDASMLFIADFSNFKTLSETLSDDHYKRRFEALFPNK